MGHCTEFFVFFYYDGVPLVICLFTWGHQPGNVHELMGLRSHHQMISRTCADLGNDHDHNMGVGSAKSHIIAPSLERTGINSDILVSDCLYITVAKMFNSLIWTASS